MTVAIISHPDCSLHEAGEQHPEQPMRIEVIQAALERFPFTKAAEFHLAPLATEEQLLRVHDENYVKWLFSMAPKEGYVSLDPDTLMNLHTLSSALRAAGAVVMAVDKIMAAEATVAFCNVRPPGHHAEANQAMGFCFFNNVAVGVAHAMACYGVERIAIVDFDEHHGNGTQAIFQYNQQVLLCSSFEHPQYPGYEPHLDNEHILNVPLPPMTEGAVFREQVKNAWFDRISAFKPQLIFFSAGFDAHVDDSISTLRLTKEDYVWITQAIATLAKIHCGGRMISVLEGGYHLEALEECVPLHVQAML